VRLTKCCINTTYAIHEGAIIVRSLFSLRREPSLPVRRLLVIVGFAGMAAWLGATVWLDRLELGRGERFGVAMVLLAVVSLPLLVLQQFRGNAARRNDPPLDEREVQRRESAFRISYRIVEVALVVGMLIVAYLWINEATLPFDAGLAVWIAYGYVIFLPSAVFAWREPDAAD
jgi:hypothetical protein